MGLAMPQCICSWQFTPPQTPQPKRKWVGLTDEQKEALSQDAEGNPWVAVELAEAKLKEKNT